MRQECMFEKISKPSIATSTSFLPSVNASQGLDTSAAYPDALTILQMVDWLTISCSELESLLPKLGMNNEFLDEMPPELCASYGMGLHFWQYPIQFAPFLISMRERPARTYLEIGSRWGGSFVIVDRLLRSLNKDLRSFAMDLIEMPALLDKYSSDADVTYIRGDSRKRETWDSLPEQMDVVFIDGDHGYDAVRSDFNMAMQLYPHTIVLHDTVSDSCPGVRLFWQDIRRVFSDTLEFHQQYPSVNGSFLGIGVVRL